MPFVKRFRFFHFATLWCGVAINYCCNRLIYWLFSATSLINRWFELANKRHTIQPLHVMLYRTVQHPQQSMFLFALLHFVNVLSPDNERRASKAAGREKRLIRPGGSSHGQHFHPTELPLAPCWGGGLAYQQGLRSRVEWTLVKETQF